MLSYSGQRKCRFTNIELSMLSLLTLAMQATFTRTLNFADIEGWKVAETGGWKLSYIFLEGWKQRYWLETDRHHFLMAGKLPKLF